MTNKLDETKYALRAIASCKGEAIVLRNMAARALFKMFSDEDCRFGRESRKTPILLVSSSQRSMVEYSREHPGGEFIFCNRIDKARGIDTRTPVVLVEPVNKELREFVKIRFTKVTKGDMM